MSMPFYASAEQIMRDRSEFARKGIARGRGVAVLTYSDGVLFVAENASSALHKVSEIYDRIAFAGVGKYPEYENLRVAGIRLADLRGYSYDRRDVTARALANAYAQTLGTIFTEQQKPYEVEICVAEVADDAAEDQLYRISYDGTIVDEPQFMVMGGQTEALATALQARLHRRPVVAGRARRRGERARVGRRTGRQATRTSGDAARGRGARPHPRCAQVPPHRRCRADAATAGARAGRRARRQPTDAGEDPAP